MREQEGGASACLIHHRVWHKRRRQTLCQRWRTLKRVQRNSRRIMVHVIPLHQRYFGIAKGNEQTISPIYLRSERTHRMQARHLAK